MNERGKPEKERRKGAWARRPESAWKSVLKDHLQPQSKNKQKVKLIGKERLGWGRRTQGKPSHRNGPRRTREKKLTAVLKNCKNADRKRSGKSNTKPMNQGEEPERVSKKAPISGPERGQNIGGENIHGGEGGGGGKR